MTDVERAIAVLRQRPGAARDFIPPTVTQIVAAAHRRNITINHEGGSLGWPFPRDGLRPGS